MDRISALMDGELEGDEATRLVEDIKEREALREAWATYHLIGEALRGEPCHDCAVMPSVSERLNSEPTVLAPKRPRGESGRRWVLPSLAAAAALASVTWMVGQQPTESLPPGETPLNVVLPTVATQAASPLVEYLQAAHLPAQPASPPPIQIPAREVDAYLMAHQIFSPSTALQGLAPYVRMVTGTQELGR